MVAWIHDKRQSCKPCDEYDAREADKEREKIRLAAAEAAKAKKAADEKAAERKKYSKPCHDKGSKN